MPVRRLCPAVPHLRERSVLLPTKDSREERRTKIIVAPNAQPQASQTSNQLESELLLQAFQLSYQPGEVVKLILVRSSLFENE